MEVKWFKVEAPILMTPSLTSSQEGKNRKAVFCLNFSCSCSDWFIDYLDRINLDTINQGDFPAALCSSSSAKFHSASNVSKD